MICFPNAKINLGLNIVRKRDDGFHDIETVFYPIMWQDVLEVVPSSKEGFNLKTSGIAIHSELNDNLLFKAYQLIKEYTAVPNIDVYLHKTLPMGAGLGGGSSDAAFFINVLNNEFDLKLSDSDNFSIAKTLGSDCAFFLNNKPVYAFHKGDEFKEVTIDLSAYYVAVIYPNIHSNTKEAYSLVKPYHPEFSILDVVSKPIDQWKNLLINDFEPSIFNLYPIVSDTKNWLYEQGAIYASMSGSGSAVFGLFTEKPTFTPLNNFLYWIGKMV